MWLVVVVVAFVIQLVVVVDTEPNLVVIEWLVVETVWGL